MCGRMNISDHQGIQSLLREFGLDLDAGGFRPSWNVAPGAAVPVIFHPVENDVALMEWGIVPVWARPGQFSRPLINARAETVWEKPSFRSLAKKNRALIVANGFYEWHREGKQKTPFHIHPASGNAFTFAGLYQLSRDGVMQCTIITTAANDVMAKIHDRMPVILDLAAARTWLEEQDRRALDDLLRPAGNDVLRVDRVSRYVNNAANDSPKCLEIEDSAMEKQDERSP